jgi:hypothetical protein
MHDRAGVFPSDPDALDALPGIGPYTARAIVCFAFDKRECFIETNIRAVYIQHFHRYFQNPEAVRDAEILTLIEATLPRDYPRIFYYALMDYGAALKKAQSNPNRQSAHYTRQSRFEGSLRQARGAIIRCLSKTGAATLEAVAEAEHIERERLEKAAAALEAEGLVACDGGVYRIRNGVTAETKAALNAYIQAHWIEGARDTVSDSASFEDYLAAQYNPETFSLLLNRYRQERGLSAQELYRRADIDRRLYSKIMNSRDYKPSKQTVAACGLALCLDSAEMDALLEAAGFALSKNAVFDLVIAYCVENKIYNLRDVNELLYDQHQPLLTRMPE